LEYSKSQPLRANAEARLNVATFIKSKRNEVTTINLVQAQDEEMYFIINLEYRYVALSREIPYGLPKKSQCLT
jgi:hypothetical protein